MDSRAFKTIYIQNVCSTGYESYKKSFQEFYETVWQPIERDQVLLGKLVDTLKRAPYNVGFGMFLYL